MSTQSVLWFTLAGFVLVLHLFLTVYFDYLITKYKKLPAISERSYLRFKILTIGLICCQISSFLYGIAYIYQSKVIRIMSGMGYIIGSHMVSDGLILYTYNS